MATKKDVINYAIDLASRGVGVDADGVYGTQCVDLPNFLSINFFGKTLWGNAIDLLNSASSAGYEVTYSDGNNAPKAGDVFVMDVNGSQYGHTGLVVTDDSNNRQLDTIEQNIDGNADALYVGAPARFNVRNMSDGVGTIIGWFTFPYSDAPAPAKPSGSTGKLIPQIATFTVKVSALNVRNKPNVGATVTGVVGEGYTITYDNYIDSDGYIWISYIGYSGNRLYMAVGESKNGKRATSYGEFK
jgi:CHAP domain./Bacterial SH3 domain.